MSQIQNNNIFEGLAQQYYDNVSKKSSIDVISFATSSWGLNVKLLPVQKFVLKCYYGMELDSIEKNIPVKDEVNEKLLHTFTEKEFMTFLIEEGRTNLKEYVPGNEFTELILCCGRRSTKSSLSSIVANYEAYKLLKIANPQKFYPMLAGQEIRITAVSVSDEDATSLFDMVLMRALNCDFLKNRMPKPGTQTYCNFQTDNDIDSFGKNKRASIRVQCGGSSANSLRGKNNIIVIFDEAAFFIDNSNRYSGQEVYNALTPSTATFTNPHTKKCDGKILTLSSPYSKSGIFWNLYNQSYRETDRMLMFKMYTSMMNPTIDPEYLKSKRRQDKQSFSREFGAEFTDNITGWLDDADVKKLDESTDKTRTVSLRQGRPNIEYFYGIDLGQKNDGIAVAIVHKEENCITLDYADVWYGSESDVWDYKDSIYKNCRELSGYDIIPLGIIADRIKKLGEAFPIRSGWFDQWSGFALDEQLKTRGVVALRTQPASEGLNMQIFQGVRGLLTDGLLKIFNHPVLTAELQLLEVERSGGKFKVHAPVRVGFHDDISTAYTRAVHECYNYYKDNTIYASQAFNKNGMETESRSMNEYYSYLKKKSQHHGGLNEKRMPNNIRGRFR